MDLRLLALPVMAIAACTSPSPPPAPPAPPAQATAPIAKVPETAPAKPVAVEAAKPVAPAKPAAAPPAVAAKPAAPPPPKTAASPPPKPVPASTPVAAAPPAPAAAPKLDLKSLEQRLKDTDAIGVMTKLSLKNQVDDLVSRFRTYHAGTRPPTLDQLRPSFDLLLMKVLSLLQDKDSKLASDIHASRDAIWSVLADPKKLAQYS